MTAPGATRIRRKHRKASLLRSASRHRARDTVIEDRVQGRVSFANKDLDDFVILRSDGTPTYMLSVVVDDHDMEITRYMSSVATTI